jgi:hypothetical protein
MRIPPESHSLVQPHRPFSLPYINLNALLWRMEMRLPGPASAKDPVLVSDRGWMKPAVVD